jgi:hypothetical protein
VHAESVAVDEVVLETSRHDAATQQVSAAKVVLNERGIQIFPVRVRYAWPFELDLMARLANLRLRDRWQSWKRDPFTNASTRHISVYETGGT